MVLPPCVCASASTCACACVNVCVRVCKREREGEREACVLNSVWKSGQYFFFTYDNDNDNYDNNEPMSSTPIYSETRL